MKFTYLQSSWNHYYYDYVALFSLPFRYFFHLRRRLSEKFVHTLSPLLVENIPLVAMLDRVDLWTWRLQSSTSFTTSSTILFPSFLRRAACYAFKKKKKNTNPLACIIRQKYKYKFSLSSSLPSSLCEYKKIRKDFAFGLLFYRWVICKSFNKRFNKIVNPSRLKQRLNFFLRVIIEFVGTEKRTIERLVSFSNGHEFIGSCWGWWW